MNQISDIDPLSSYMYPSYENYNPTLLNVAPSYYDVKVEQQSMNDLYSNCYSQQQTSSDNVITNLTESQFKPTDTSNSLNLNNYGKDFVSASDQCEMKPLLQIKKEKGKKSTYWSEKITDADFKFYGCSVCNISYDTLNELDTHVTVHKDRVTSYDLKLKNIVKRKQKKKELKKIKSKAKAMKSEDKLMEIEIKPEDGYIGNAVASAYAGNNENEPSNNEDRKDSNNDDKEDVKPDIDDKVKGDNTNQLGVPPPVAPAVPSAVPPVVPADSRESKTDDELMKKNLGKIYKCFACQKQFTLSYYLKLHVRSHTDEKPYSCQVCGQSFITASKLGRHNKRVHLAIRFQCRICYRFFTSFEILTTHFDKKHPDDKLEGEPYDYNAILPYLKELEEELKEKARVENEKPKTNDIWDEFGPVPDETDPVLVPKNEMTEVEVDGDSNTQRTKVEIELVKIDPADIDVKVELEELDEPEGGDAVKSEDEVDNVKDERASDDEDYFPPNTWAQSPKPDSPKADTATTKTKVNKGCGPHKCSVCQKTMATASYLKIHMRTHTGEKPFKCYICDRGFITASKMHRHVLIHEETWEGDDAQVKLEHIKADPDNKDGDITDTKALIKKAKAKFTKKLAGKNKHKTRPHSCEFCQKKFLHLETLQVHKKSHEGEELVLKCKFCLEPSPDEEALKTHEETHTGPKPYLCTICGNTYKKKETMVYHRKHHKPVKRHACPACPATFDAACKLRRHALSHGRARYTLRYECPVCAHMFHTRYHVQAHLASHQREGLIYEENRNEVLAMALQNARKIPQTTEKSINLTDIVPADERSRICNICGEIFQHFYYLEEHLKSHGSKIAVEDLNKEEEKKHVCQVCNKSFKLHYYLKLHSFTHTKEKPYICQQCGKGFITKGKLKRHLETHSGLKKYQCHICYKFFTRTSYLRIHVRTIHGTQDYNFRMDGGYSREPAPMPMEQGL